MQFSVCIDALFGKNIYDSFDILAKQGFEYAEFWSWTNKDIDRILKCSRDSGVKIAAICTSEFDLTDPRKRDIYAEGLKRSVEVAQKIDCKTLISQVGNDTGDERALQHESIVEGLKMSADILEGSGITLVIEPLNTRVNHKGYYLDSSDEAFGIVDKVNSENIKVLFDIYHQQITEGDLLAHILPNLSKIGHFHAAGVPGRHELLNNEINYDFVLSELKRVGCTAKVGLEYMPTIDAEQSLSMLKTELINRYL